MKKLLRLISVATMLLAATSFMACSSDDDDDSGARSASEHARGAIVGVVLDNRGEPVEGATVTLGNKTASTNHGGEFVLENVDVNDPKVKAIQTKVGSGSSTTTTTGSTTVTTTAADSKLEPTEGTAPTLPAGSTLNYAYTLTVTKDGYLSGLVDGIYVTSAENIGGIEDARLSALRNEYAKILEAYAKAVGESSALTSTGDVIGATLKDTEDKSATMTTVAGALKEIQKLYSELGTTYSSTWASANLIPLNASLKGTLKLNPSPATAEVFNATTYTPSKKTKVTVTYNRGKDYSKYTYKAETDENGNFSFEKLPSGVTLGLAVEGFTDKAGDVTAYFSTDGGKDGYRSNAAEILNNSSATLGSFTIDPNCLNVAGLDIMLFAQLEKIWVVNTNLLKNNDAALISVKDDITFEFNKEISRVSLEGSGFQDVTDKNYTVTIDATDAKKVTVKANDGVWNPVKITDGAATDPKTLAKAGEVKLTVLAKDGTKELLNASFQACFDTNIFVSITESSKNDKLLALSAPVVLTFSKPMSTASVSAKVAKASGSDLTNNFTKTWSEDGTTLTLTPTKFWDKVDSDDGGVIFTVTGVAKDETTTIKYWKTNSDTTTGTDANGIDKFNGLKVYFDNYIDVTLAKVSETKFTATFSKALKAIPAADLDTNFEVYYSATASGLVPATGVTTPAGTKVTDAKLSLDGSVLTVEAKNGDFEHYGYYAVYLKTDDVVGATGETKFRKSGATSAATVKEFASDFTLGKEFKEATIKIVDALPEGVNASRAVYADAAKWIEVTFTKDVAKSNLKVDGETVVNYIKGAAVYLPLAKVADDHDVNITGNVTATNGDPKEYTAASPLKSGYKVTKETYKMVASSLYTQKASIAGKNDATVTKIKPTDNVTFTFVQDVSAATWTAELYDQYNVGQKDLEQTLYKVTATAAGKVVTVALAEGSKALVNGETYYLSLKAVTGSGDTEIVRYDSNEFEVKKTVGTETVYNTTNYAWVDGGTSVTLGEKIVKAPVTGYKYIEIITEAADAKYDNLYVVKAGKNSATTDFDEFKKSNQSPIKLEFNESIEGFSAVLATSDKKSAWTTKDLVEAKDTYTSTYAISEEGKGKVLTITPTYAFPSDSSTPADSVTVYPIVFNAEGGVVALKNVAGKSFYDTNNDDTEDKFFKPIDYSSKLDKVVEGAKASAKLAVTQFNKDKTGNKTNVWFQFKPIKSDATGSYGVYTLYKKVTKVASAASEWAKVGEYKLDDNSLQYVDPTKTTDSEKLATIRKAVTEDFALRNMDACIVAATGVSDFYYSKTAQYKLVCKLDNDMIWSAPVTVEDKKLNIKFADGYADPTGFTSTPSAISTLTYTVEADCYLKELTVAVTPGGSGTRLTASKVTAEPVADSGRTKWTITITSGTEAAKDDKITLTGKDPADVTADLEIKFKE